MRCPVCGKETISLDHHFIRSYWCKPYYCQMTRKEFEARLKRMMKGEKE